MITEIPKSFMYTCDICRSEHLQENAGGHYRDSRPPHWSRLKLAQDAHDFQGHAVADATIERLLCSECTSRVSKAINDEGEKIRRGKTD